VADRRPGKSNKIAGIWMNADSHRFRSAPSFYAIATSEPIEKLVDERTAAIYELGLDNPSFARGGALPDKERRSRRGCLICASAPVFILKIRRAWRSARALYRARIIIPSQVPVGTYTADIPHFRPPRDCRRDSRN
jgi:hypothetical protein